MRCLALLLLLNAAATSALIVSAPALRPRTVTTCPRHAASTPVMGIGSRLKSLVTKTPKEESKVEAPAAAEVKEEAPVAKAAAPKKKVAESSEDDGVASGVIAVIALLVISNGLSGPAPRPRPRPAVVRSAPKPAPRKVRAAKPRAAKPDSLVAQRAQQRSAKRKAAIAERAKVVKGKGAVKVKAAKEVSAADATEYKMYKGRKVPVNKPSAPAPKAAAAKAAPAKAAPAKAAAPAPAKKAPARADEVNLREAGVKTMRQAATPKPVARKGEAQPSYMVFPDEE